MMGVLGSGSNGFSKLIIFTMACLVGCSGFQEEGESDTFPILEFRSMDGSGNNLQHSQWGSTSTVLSRLTAPAYGDGISSPAGENRPNPREISNLISAQQESIPNARGLSNFVFMWGQFIDHDIDLTPDDADQPWPISVPIGDPFFDPQGTGLVEIPFFRSTYVVSTGTSVENPRQQINVITTWMDASQVYGSDEERAAWLRTGQKGQLKTSNGNLLPFNDGSLENAPDNATDLFVAGDVRANEQAALAAMHTLFVREHNRLCEELSEQHPDWTDEQIYQQARKWVGALMQVITFNEFLPALLGPHRPGPYQGYDPAVDPTILNEFSTACFRMGHSMLTSELWRLDDRGEEVAEGSLSLAEAFFDPTRILIEGGIDPLLRGLAFQPMEAVDPKLVDEVRNFLFGAPGAGGLDLVALNLRRGRDHGLADYNTLRVALGLRRITDFKQITSDLELADHLETLYGSVDQIDPWVGVLSENPLPGASVGETIREVLVLQFEKLRTGDRFWYENDPAFSEEDLRKLRNTRLSTIIRRNTAITNIPDNVFRVP